MERIQSTPIYVDGPEEDNYRSSRFLAFLSRSDTADGAISFSLSAQFLFHPHICFISIKHQTNGPDEEASIQESKFASKLPPVGAYRELKLLPILCICDVFSGGVP